MPPWLTAIFGWVGPLITFISDRAKNRDTQAARPDLIKRQTEQVAQAHDDQVNTTIAKAEGGDADALEQLRREASEN